jgi:hypothetical protein
VAFTAIICTVSKLLKRDLRSWVTTDMLGFEASSWKRPKHRTPAFCTSGWKCFACTLPHQSAFKKSSQLTKAKHHICSNWRMKSAKISTNYFQHVAEARRNPPLWERMVSKYQSKSNNWLFHLLKVSWSGVTN